MVPGEGQGVRRPPVDLVWLVAREFNATRQIAAMALAHGKVTIDDEAVGLVHRYEFTREDLAGAMLGLHMQRRRVFGSRPVDRHDALMSQKRPSTRHPGDTLAQVETPVQGTLFR